MLSRLLLTRAATDCLWASAMAAMAMASLSSTRTRMIFPRRRFSLPLLMAGLHGTAPADIPCQYALYELGRRGHAYRRMGDVFMARSALRHRASCCPCPEGQRAGRPARATNAAHGVRRLTGPPDQACSRGRQASPKGRPGASVTGPGDASAAQRTDARPPRARVAGFSTGRALETGGFSTGVGRAPLNKMSEAGG